MREKESFSICRQPGPSPLDVCVQSNAVSPKHHVTHTRAGQRTLVEQDTDVLQHEAADDLAEKVTTPPEGSLELLSRRALEQRVRAVLKGRGRPAEEEGKVLICRQW